MAGFEPYTLCFLFLSLRTLALTGDSPFLLPVLASLLHLQVHKVVVLVDAGHGTQLCLRVEQMDGVCGTIARHAAACHGDGGRASDGHVVVGCLVVGEGTIVA